MILKTCPICKKEFEFKKNSRETYCGRACALVRQKKLWKLTPRQSKMVYN